MMSRLRRWIGSARGMRTLINVYGPYLGAGIRVTHVANDFSSATVEMNLHWYNSNYVGTHFGGSLYSMVDPMYMLLLMNRLGSDYVVWDKAASIDFVRPGTGRVKASFEISDARLEEIRLNAADGNRTLPEWTIDITDEQGDLVAQVRKTLYVRIKQPQAKS